jgi:hypothetical protein
LYEGYLTEFAPEASKISGLKLNSKNLNLKIKSIYVEKIKIMRILFLKIPKKPKLLYGSL